jgi:hypothetical protein
MVCRRIIYINTLQKVDNDDDDDYDDDDNNNNNNNNNNNLRKNFRAQNVSFTAGITVRYL